MRIATFNVLHGRPFDDGHSPSAPEQPLADAVAALDVDILALQELDRYQARSGDIDQAEVAATAMGATDWRYASALHARAVPDIGWVRDRDSSDLRVHGPGDAAYPTRISSHGTALLTRRPVSSWRVRRFPGAPGALPLHVVGRKGLTIVRDHARVAIAAVLDGGPRGPVTVVATHLSFVPGWNLGQLAALYRWISDLPRPHVLLGDLNLVGPLPRALLVGGDLVEGLVNRAPIEHRWHDLARIATYPAPRPLVQFDHVLAAGIPSSAVRVSCAPRSSISDHRPLIVELDE